MCWLAPFLCPASLCCLHIHVSLIPSKKKKEQHGSFYLPCNNEKLHEKTKQCTQGPLLPSFPNVSGMLSRRLAPTHLIKVLPAFEIASPLSPLFCWSPPLPFPKRLGGVLLYFFPSSGLACLYLPVLKAVSHTLIYSLSQERQETLMKQQTARVINTHQTFNCTISEQYVRMYVREHCQLERNRQR